jgi:hypothetical protein
MTRQKFVDDQHKRFGDDSRAVEMQENNRTANPGRTAGQTDSRTTSTAAVEFVMRRTGNYGDIRKPENGSSSSRCEPNSMRFIFFRRGKQKTNLNSGDCRKPRCTDTPTLKFHLRRLGVWVEEEEEMRVGLNAERGTITDLPGPALHRLELASSPGVHGVEIYLNVKADYKTMFENRATTTPDEPRYLDSTPSLTSAGLDCSILKT